MRRAREGRGKEIFDDSNVGSSKESEWSNPCKAEKEKKKKTGPRLNQVFFTWLYGHEYLVYVLYN